MLYVDAIFVFMGIFVLDVDRRQRKPILLTFVCIVLLTNMPFFPGPAILCNLSNLLFILGQFIGVLSVFAVPYAFLELCWELFTKNRAVHITLNTLIYLGMPVVCLWSTKYIASKTRKWSKEVIITNAKPLTTAIEEYKTQRGSYPSTLSEAGIVVPATGIMGTKTYYYNKIDTSFNLTFYQNVILGFNSDVVVYDPRDRHKPEGELKYLYETGYKHWKFYVYD